MYIYLYNGDVLEADTIEFSNVAPEVIINGSSTVPIIEILRIKEGSTEWFGVVRWCDADIAEALSHRGVPPTENNIAVIRTVIENGKHFTDPMIEAGWYTIYELIDGLACMGEFEKEGSE